MKRREVLALLAGLAAIHPIEALTQPPPIRLIGVLIGIAETDPDAPGRVAALRQGLQELGWVEGVNIRLAFRWATDPDRIRAFATELVALNPDVIIASSSPVAAALLRETRTIPIVFVTASDPVGDRFVTSIGSPGGNATGFTSNLASMGGKWLELLRAVAPGVTRIAILFNQDTAPRSGSYFLQPIEAAAASFSIRSVPTPVREAAQIESSLAEFAREPGGGLIVAPDNFTTIHRTTIVALTARYGLPAVYPFRYFAVAGGLISYGADLTALYRRSSIFVDRILKGAKPADLPVQAPAKIDLVINLKTARALGLTVPRLILARADEVIE